MFLPDIRNAYDKTTDGYWLVVFDVDHWADISQYPGYRFRDRQTFQIPTDKHSVTPLTVWDLPTLP